MKWVSIAAAFKGRAGSHNATPDATPDTTPDPSHENVMLPTARVGVLASAWTLSCEHSTAPIKAQEKTERYHPIPVLQCHLSHLSRVSLHSEPQSKTRKTPSSSIIASAMPFVYGHGELNTTRRQRESTHVQLSTCKA